MDEEDYIYSEDVEEELRLLSENIGDLDELLELILAPYEGSYIVEDDAVLDIDHCIACLDIDDVYEDWLD